MTRTTGKGATIFRRGYQKYRKTARRREGRPPPEKGTRTAL